MAEAEAAQPLPKNAWYPEIQVMTARSRDGSEKGFFLAVKGGHNSEHHNHNDVGNLIVYTDGKPLLVDAGVGTYTAQNSGPNRYEIWTMSSANHNLPIVNGEAQRAGKSFASKILDYQSTDETIQLVQDISGAYSESAGLISWVRTTTLNRDADILITDSYELESVTGEVSVTFLTPAEVTLESPGNILLKKTDFGQNRDTGAGKIAYDGTKLKFTLQEIQIEDPKLSRVWGDRLFKIELQAIQPLLKDTWSFRVTTEPLLLLYSPTSLFFSKHRLFTPQSA